MRARFLIAVVSAAVLPAACGRPPARAQANAEAVQRYGFGPVPNDHIRYQPNVVLMTDGPAAIKGDTDAGLTYIVDGGAKGARDLAPGKIMFASSRVVGRVLAVQPRGSDLAVSIAPVALTDIVRDGRITFDHKLESGTRLMARRGGPVRPDAAVMPAVWRPGENALFRPARLLRSDDSSQGNYKGKVKIGEWDISPFIKHAEKRSADAVSDSEEIGVTVSKKLESGAAKGVKVGGTLALYGQNIHIRSNIVIAGGQVDDQSSFSIEGVDGIRAAFTSGTDESGANAKVRLEWPTDDLKWDIPPQFTEGIPLAFTIRIKVFLETAFSARNSTIWGDGRYNLKGPIGFQGSSIEKPELSVDKPMLDSIDGISVGAAGFVFGGEIRFLLGVGRTEIALAGPYGKVIVSIGGSRGSALGMPIADCRGVTLKVDVGAGVGIQFNSTFFDALTSFLGEAPDSHTNETLSLWKKQLGQAKVEADLKDTTWNVVERDAYFPDTPICTGR